ncbi:alpha/beta fold hydrolase [Parvularcula oceani]|uniref:alpha/beta fold hydrolase n=1 Tax=Parvularcula oceani TaxID=1247963 RepID=UPI000568B965|nr:alpha/beta hydrolase [Parvularcula oceani]
MTDKNSGTNAARPAALSTDGPNGRIAYLRSQGSGPGIVWLGGYASDMRGTKAEAVSEWAEHAGRACVRFDYTGHGESEGQFEDGTIGRWLDDALHVLDNLTSGPQVLVGSSMGAWIAGLIAKRRPERLAGLLLLAPAPDFTQDLTRKDWSAEDKAKLERDGRVAFPSAYDDSEMVYTKALFEDGAKHLILHEPLPIPCPVRIIQGTKDESVPWTHGVRTAEHMEGDDITVTLVKDADHRLSTPNDIARLLRVLAPLGC